MLFGQFQSIPVSSPPASDSKLLLALERPRSPQNFGDDSNDLQSDSQSPSAMLVSIKYNCLLELLMVCRGCQR